MSKLGQIGEKFAANYLISQKYSIVKANYINKVGYRIGEVDLIARDENGWYVFVEVKARKGKPGFVVPEENITNKKLEKIIKTANNFLSSRGEVDCPWRVDVITVIFDMISRKAEIRHIKHIHF